MFGQMRKSLFGFEALYWDVVRCWKTVPRIECFRWPQGPAETIQYALRNKKAVRNIQLQSNDVWLG